MNGEGLSRDSEVEEVDVHDTARAAQVYDGLRIYKWSTVFAASRRIAQGRQAFPEGWQG